MVFVLRKRIIFIKNNFIIYRELNFVWGYGFI